MMCVRKARRQGRGGGGGFCSSRARGTDSRARTPRSARRRLVRRISARPPAHSPPRVRLKSAFARAQSLISPPHCFH